MLMLRQKPMLPTPQFKARLINVVLATDMANHFDILSKFKSTFMGSAVDATDEERMQPNMELILQMVIKCADLGHCTMMRKTHLFWSKCLEEEFFLQGDQEKATGTKPSELSPLTDRDQLGERREHVFLGHTAKALSLTVKQLCSPVWSICIGAMSEHCRSAVKACHE